jgi:hypothetical protein
MRLNKTAFLLLSVFGAAPAWSAPEPLLSFDWNTSNTSPAADGWSFVPMGNTGCSGTMTEQDRFCNAEHRLFLTYPTYDSDHMGWMRYGVLDVEKQGAAPSLKLWMTGGRAKNAEGLSQDYGVPVRGLKEYATAKLTFKESTYADRTLPGMPSLYYKAIVNEGPMGLFPQHNRFQLQVWMPKAPNRHARYSRNSLDRKKNPQPAVSWYPFIDSAKGAHYYHLTYNRAYGGWMTIAFDAHPSDDNTGVNNETNSFREGGKHSPGYGIGYFQRLAAFAVRFNGLNGSASPAMVLTNRWEKDYVPYENEETLNSLAVGYDPESQAFDVSLEDKYRCATCAASYEVRYSFAPISNGNFDNASPVLKTENFFVEDDNANQWLIKGNPYGNAVWGKITLPPADVVRYLKGEAIYLAVRDTSNRTIVQDERDRQLIFTPDGAIEMQRLIKQLKLQYQAPPQDAEIQAPPVIMSQQKQLWLPIANEGLDGSGIKARANYEIRASVLTSDPVSTVSLKPYQSGEYDLMLHGKSAEGSRVQTPVKVKVDAPLCTQTLSCSGMPVVNWVTDPALQPYQELGDLWTARLPFGAGIHAGDYYTVSGNGLFVAGTEMVEVRLKNSGAVAQTLSPRISSRVKMAPGDLSVSPIHQSPLSWRMMEPKLVQAGEQATWWVPLQEFAQGYLSALTVHVGSSVSDVQVMSIGLHTEYPLRCTGCETVLVDFHAAGSIHLAPQPGWADIFKAGNTGQVGEGLGITIGSTASASFQGIRGTSELSSKFRQVAVIWKNAGLTTITFSPQHSLTDPDAPTSGVAGTWLKSEPLTVLPGGEVRQVLSIPSGTRMININVNHAQNKTLWLDKIIGLN